MYYPNLNEPNVVREVTDTWYGVNRNLRIAVGELSDDLNMSAKDYPVLSTRAHRGIGTSIASPQGMIAKDSLAYVDGADLYYNGNKVTGVVLSTATTDQPKQLVGIGAYIVIFPDKYYVNTVDLTDHGSINVSNSITATAISTVTASVCKRDGTAYEDMTVSPTAPADPSNGDVWLDTSGDVHSLKIWNSVNGMWVSQATTYVRISASGIGTNLNQYDGIQLSGLAATGTTVKQGESDATADERAQLEALNGSQILYGVGTNFIVIAGLLDKLLTQTSGTVASKRSCPDMDFVVEAGNRLWGCKYGHLSTGETVNTIYGSALGDFKNWEKFLGVSTDSWYGGVGSDGKFTGAVTWLGSPVFFKENCIHTVAISATGAHQITTTNCRGVQDGSAKSACVVGKTVYYKSPVDVCAYEGALPVSVSSQFADDLYTNAVAGSIGSLYYITMEDANHHIVTKCYDAAKGIWHNESPHNALCYARVDTDLYYINSSTKKLMTVNGSSEGDFDWYFETEDFGYQYQVRGYGSYLGQQNYLSRVNMRMSLDHDAEAWISVMYDGCGKWEPRGHVRGMGVRSFTFPIVPRRCDHMRIKIEGHGDCTVYSLAKILEVGSDVV